MGTGSHVTGRLVQVDDRAETENTRALGFACFCRGVLRVLDERKVGFADFRGNRQYITTGNIRGDSRVALFLMDYANRQRLKIMARAEIFDASESPELIERLEDKHYNAHVERAIVYHVVAFDWNCPQHITPRWTAEEFPTLS